MRHDAGMTAMRAFAQEAAAVEATIDGLESVNWKQPGLGEWTVAELVAHLVRGADRITAYLDQPVEGDEPVCDRVSYFDFDTEAAAAGVADRARADAASVGTTALPEVFRQAWRTTLDRTQDLPADRLIHTFRGPMAVEEFTATRVLELTVHHVDLCRATARRPATTAAGLAITVDILDGLLDGPRPTTLDDASFMLAATGRDTHPDPRFPVLS